MNITPNINNDFPNTPIAYQPQNQISNIKTTLQASPFALLKKVLEMLLLKKLDNMYYYMYIIDVYFMYTYWVYIRGVL